MNDIQNNSVSNDTQPKKRRSRGTIIVDSSAFFYLPYKSKYPFVNNITHSESSIPYYTDLLVFLSEHGYDIVIPEMVSVEVAQVLSDGHHTHKLFPKTATDMSNQAVNFLKNCGRGIYPHIKILSAPQEAASNAATYMRNFRNVFFSNRSDSKKKSMIKAITASGHPNYGEQAAADLVQYSNLSYPIFYLSNDHGSFKTVRNGNSDTARCPIRNLSLLGLLDALHQRGILDQLGIPGPNPIQLITDDMIAQYNKIVKLQAALIISIDHRGNSTSREKPFYESLGGLKEELAAEKNPSTSTATPSTAGSGRAAAFVEKYANRGVTIPGNGANDVRHTR
jgi:hypothetical protein